MCADREHWIAALCITVPMILIYIDDAMDSECDSRPRADRLREGSLACLTLRLPDCTVDKSFTVAATWIGLFFIGFCLATFLRQSYYTATYWADVSSRGLSSPRCARLSCAARADRTQSTVTLLDWFYFCC